MRKSICALAAASALAACGGGGDAGSSVFTGAPVTATTYNVAAANHNLLTTTASWTTTGTAAGQNYGFSLSYQPLAAGSFSLNGASSSRTQESLTFSSNLGSTTATNVLYVTPATDALVGQYDPANGTCAVVSGNTALPTTASVGSSGSLYINSALSSCDSTGTVTQTDTVTWSLETDNGVILFCQNDAASDAVGSNIPGTLSLCFAISPDGTLGSRARFTVNIPGLSLSVVTRNY